MLQQILTYGHGILSLISWRVRRVIWFCGHGIISRRVRHDHVLGCPLLNEMIIMNDDLFFTRQRFYKHGDE